MNSSTNSIMQFLDRYYRWFHFGVVVIVLTIGWLLLLGPQYQALTASGVLQYQTVLNTLSNHQRYLEDIRTMAERYSDFDQRVFYALDLILPPPRDKELLYADVEALFVNTNFTVESLNIAPVTAATATTSTTPVPTVPANIQPYTVSVNVKTNDPSYDNFKKLITHLEQSNQLLNLQAISYSPSNLSFSLIFTTYQRKPL